MTNVRTHRQREFFTISNASCQEEGLSFAARGLLAYCLSMPPSWEFSPKNLWKQSGLGRNKTYELFNELIQFNRCLRVYESKSKGFGKGGYLRGAVIYEIFDDVSDCLARKEELISQGYQVESGRDLKKCLRHPDFRDSEKRDVIKNDISLKDIPKTNKQKPPESSFVRSSESENENHEKGLIEDLLAPYGFGISTMKKLLKKTYAEVEQSYEAFLQYQKNHPLEKEKAVLVNAILEGWKPNSPSKKKQEEAENSRQNEIFEKNKDIATQVLDHIACKEMSLSCNCIWVTVDGARFPLSFADDDFIETFYGMLREWGYGSFAGPS